MKKLAFVIALALALPALAGDVVLSDGANYPNKKLVGVAAAGTAPDAAQNALVVGISPAGTNPCANPNALLSKTTGTTSGNSAVEILAAVASKTIHICSLNVVGVSGTTPAFSLVDGTGSNCGTGQGVVLQSFSTTAAVLYPFAGPVSMGGVGKALCYLNTGTTPVQKYTLTYVQQ